MHLILKIHKNIARNAERHIVADMKTLFEEMEEMIAEINVGNIADHINEESLFNFCGAWREETTRILNDIKREIGK